jgi:hypothetical protein
MSNSIAASVARLVVAGLLKPAFSPRVPMAAQRRWVVVATAVLPPPRGVRFEKVTLDGVPCERAVPRAAGQAQPAGLALISPWCDLSNTRLAKVHFDPLLSAEWLEFCAAAYCRGLARTDPLVSPLHSELSGLPPMLMHAAGQEILLDDARRLAAACARAGVPCPLREFEPMWHDFQLYAGVVPEATESVNELAAFARERVRP